MRFVTKPLGLTDHELAFVNSAGLIGDDGGCGRGRGQRPRLLVGLQGPFGLLTFSAQLSRDLVAGTSLVTRRTRYWGQIIGMHPRRPFGHPLILSLRRRLVGRGLLSIA